MGSRCPANVSGRNFGLENNFYIFQNQKGVWGEEPFKFDPNRFLDKNADSLHPYQNIPFSAGRRSCIGRHFAMQELKVPFKRLN